MWRSVAPLLAGDFTAVCADLRGYGRSSCPASAADHAPYAKRAMARSTSFMLKRGNSTIDAAAAMAMFITTVMP